MADVKYLRKVFTSIREELDGDCGTNVTADDMLWLLDQLEAAQKDAARYQWLRDENDWHAEPRLDAADGTVWKLTMYSPQEIMDPTDDDSLDAAIDAAMSSQA